MKRVANLFLLVSLLSLVIVLVSSAPSEHMVGTCAVLLLTSILTYDLVLSLRLHKKMKLVNSIGEPGDYNFHWVTFTISDDGNISSSRLPSRKLLLYDLSFFIPTYRLLYWYIMSINDRSTKEAIIFAHHGKNKMRVCGRCGFDKIVITGVGTIPSSDIICEYNAVCSKCNNNLYRYDCGYVTINQYGLDIKVKYQGEQISNTAWT